MMESRASLLKRLSACEFAVWELHLYLDTHPDCQEAKVWYNKHMENRKALTKQYEEHYGPLMSNHIIDVNTSWQWVCNPWPWEQNACREVR